MASILEETKKQLNVPASQTAFDVDITMHINSVLSQLNQLGIGPEDGFMLESGEETWEDLLGDEKRYNMVKSWLYLKVRMLFDPPTLGYVITSWEKVIDEYTWRIAVMRQDIDFPLPPAPDEEDDGVVVDHVVLDGGQP